MTKKDYIKIAEVFKSQPRNEQLEDVIFAFAGMLSSDNPRFDRQKFLKASGVSQR